MLELLGGAVPAWIAVLEEIADNHYGGESLVLGSLAALARGWPKREWLAGALHPALLNQATRFGRQHMSTQCFEQSRHPEVVQVEWWPKARETLSLLYCVGTDPYQVNLASKILEI